LISFIFLEKEKKLKTLAQHTSIIFFRNNSKTS
jgi:hypothetical protein